MSSQVDGPQGYPYPVTPLAYSSSPESRNVRDLSDILLSPRVNQVKKTSFQKGDSPFFQNTRKLFDIFNPPIPEDIQREIDIIKNELIPLDQRLLRWLMLWGDSSINDSAKAKLNEALQTIPVEKIKEIMSINEGQMEGIQELIFETCFSVFEDNNVVDSEKLHKLLFLLENFPPDKLPTIFTGFYQDSDRCEQNVHLFLVVMPKETDNEPNEFFESIQRGEMNEQKDEIIARIRGSFSEMETFEAKNQDGEIERLTFPELLEDPIEWKNPMVAERAAEELVEALCQHFKDDETKLPGFFKAFAKRQPEVYTSLVFPIIDAIVTKDEETNRMIMDKILAKTRMKSPVTRSKVKVSEKLQGKIYGEVVLDYICSDRVDWDTILSGLEAWLKNDDFEED